MSSRGMTVSWCVLGLALWAAAPAWAQGQAATTERTFRLSEGVTLFVLNPYKVPLEPDYTDTSLSLTLPLNPSPCLSVEMFMLNYTIGGVYYL